MTWDTDGPRKQANQSYEVLSEKAARAMMIFERAAGGTTYADVRLEKVNIRLPQAQGGELLVVLTGQHGEYGPVVAFHTSVLFMEAVIGAAARLQNGSLNWKEDAFRT